MDDDDAFELKLRPTRLAEFIGQTKAKEQLAIALEAAKSRGEALDHVLLFGPPGLGKTTLATIIANELGVGFQQTSGPALQIQGDLTAILTNLRERQVLFLDEIHRLQPVLEEKLYTALEDYKLDIMIGHGAERADACDGDQAVYVCGGDDAAGAAEFAAAVRGLGFCCGWSFIPTTSCGSWWSGRRRCWGCRSIAMARRRLRCGRGGRRGLRTGCCGGCGTMRRCGRRGRSTATTAMAALEMLEVDAHGFDELDRRLLRTIIEKYDGGPVGLNTLAAALAEEQDALEEVYEPFLIQIGFLDRTPRGRVATRLAYEHLGIEMPRKMGLFG